MNVIAYPCFFETVRFPTQDKSETLSLLHLPLFVTLQDSKVTQNNIPIKEYCFLCSGLYYNTITKISKGEMRNIHSHFSFSQPAAY